MGLLLNNIGIFPILLGIYYIIHMFYEYLTKTDIERVIKYRGKEIIILSLVLILFMCLIFSLNLYINNTNQFDIIVILLTSLTFSIFTWFIIVISLSVATLIIPQTRYFIKLDEEEWRILKITRDNNAILICQKAGAVNYRIIDKSDLKNKVIFSKAVSLRDKWNNLKDTWIRLKEKLNN